MENSNATSRNAIKDADYYYKGRSYSADMAVTTFTDEDGDAAKMVSGVVRSPIGAIHVGHEVREDSVWATASFHEDVYENREITVRTHGAATFSCLDGIAVTLQEGCHYGIGGGGSEMSMYVSNETARQMAEAILAQLAADEVELESAN